MRRSLPFIIALGVFVMAPTVHAEWSTVWNFSGGAKIDNEWSANNAVLTQVPEGMHVHANTNGGFARMVNASHPVDSLIIVFAQSTPGTAVFVWHRQNDPQGKFVQLPFAMEGTPNEQITMPLSNFPDWDPWADIVGIGFTSPSDVTIKSITLYGRNGVEKAWEMTKSFFVPDTFLPYSINFLWGPLLVDTPIARSFLYKGQPPMGWSVNRVFYAFLILCALLIAAWELRQKLRGFSASWKRSIAIFFACFSVLWLVYDARMGAELISYFVRDIQTYVLPPLGKKEFRDYKNLQDALTQSLPVLTATPHYVVLAPEPSAIRKMAAYWTYPKSLPLFPGDDTSKAGAFFVFYSDDTIIDAHGRLMRLIKGVPTVLASSGSITKFDDKSFLYVPKQ